MDCHHEKRTFGRIGQLRADFVTMRVQRRGFAPRFDHAAAPFAFKRPDGSILSDAGYDATTRLFTRVAMLDENNIRTGFLEREQYERLWANCRITSSPFSSSAITRALAWAN